MTRRNLIQTAGALIAAPGMSSANIKAPVAESPDIANLISKAAIASGIPSHRVKTTTWRPDTCGCELQYAWDRATIDDADNRVHHPVTAKCCEHHACYTDVREAHAAVIAENQAKNRAVSELAEAKGIGYDAVKWAYDKDRKLTVEA